MLRTWSACQRPTCCSVSAQQQRHFIHPCCNLLGTGRGALNELHSSNIEALSAPSMHCQHSACTIACSMQSPGSAQLEAETVWRLRMHLHAQVPVWTGVEWLLQTPDTRCGIWLMQSQLRRGHQKPAPAHPSHASHAYTCKCTYHTVRPSRCSYSL